MGKHAYLIMAHSEWDLLRSLLRLIDDDRNDIYIHIDKKAVSFNKDLIIKEAKKSTIYFTDRINVMWGGASQIECEIALLKASLPGNYDYYHLLSGQDLPIKSQDYIHDFFNKNKGKEFINFESETFIYHQRVRYYHFFINKIGRSRTLKALPFKVLEKISLAAQKLLGVNRNKNNNLQYQKGAQWFSITNDLAEYIVSQSEEILKKYKFTHCCDEIFLQTLVVNSPFVNNLYHMKFDNDMRATMRLIDWERGNPYVFRKNDFNELIQSEMLFARKFSMRIDADIVDLISKHVQTVDMHSGDTAK